MKVTFSNNYSLQIDGGEECSVSSATFVINRHCGLAPWWLVSSLRITEGQGSYESHGVDWNGLELESRGVFRRLTNLWPTTQSLF